MKNEFLTKEYIIVYAITAVVVVTSLLFVIFENVV